MGKTKKIKNVVAEILETREDARKNDDLLYLYVCEHYNEEAPSLHLRTFLKYRKEMYCPSFESVNRAKRIFFEKRPDLKPEENNKTK